MFAILYLTFCYGSQNILEFLEQSWFQIFYPLCDHVFQVLDWKIISLYFKAHSYWLSKDMLIAFTWQSSYVFKNLCKPSNLASKYSLPYINLCNSQHWHLGYCFPCTFYKLINYALKFHFTDYYFLMNELIIFHWKYFTADCYHFIGRL